MFPPNLIIIDCIVTFRNLWETVGEIILAYSVL